MQIITIIVKNNSDSVVDGYMNTGSWTLYQPDPYCGSKITFMFAVLWDEALGVSVHQI